MEHVRRPRSPAPAGGDDPARRSTARDARHASGQSGRDRTDSRRRRVGRRRRPLRHSRPSGLDPRPGRAAAPAAAALSPLTNLAHLDFLLDEATPPADVPGTRRTGSPTSRRSSSRGRTRMREPGGTFERVGGGAFDAATEQLGSGGVQRRRHRACGRGLPAALDADRRRDEPRQRVRAAPLDRVPSDDRRTERGQRRAVDAARRHAQPVRRADGAARPVRFRTELLARPHDLGARRGLCRLPGRRPGIRGASSRTDWRCRWRAGPSGAGRLRRVDRVRRHARARVADRGRR